MKDWDKIFHDTEISLMIQSKKPPHETARNIFREDRDSIMAAAKKHGFKIVGPTTSTVSFVRI